MLLPDNIHPELSLYYNGAMVFKELKEQDSQLILDLYRRVKNATDMSFSTFILSLDWLYLINVAKVDGKGCVDLCI